MMTNRWNNREFIRNIRLRFDRTRYLPIHILELAANHSAGCMYPIRRTVIAVTVIVKPQILGCCLTGLSHVGLFTKCRVRHHD